MGPSTLSHTGSSSPFHRVEGALTSILNDFLDDYEVYSTEHPSIHGTNEKLEAFMREEMQIRGLSSSQLEKTVHLAASLIEMGYHSCTFAEKKNIALYNWYLIYIDDTSSKDVAPFVAFEYRFLRGVPQLDPVLDALASVLHTMFDLYTPFYANAIISATFDFINGTCVEPEIEQLQLAGSSTRFPWFLRDRTGVAIAFALMLFPKSKALDYVACFHAMADMDFWISVTNDLLSFHKESIAGETTNYISNRARVEQKSALEIVLDITTELSHSRKNIYAALESSSNDDAIEVWRAWELGYIAWHFEQKRYRLGDLGLSRK